MSESIKKFDFGTEFNFGNGSSDGNRTMPKTSFTVEEAEQIRADSFAEGERSALARAAEASSQALDEIGSQLSHLLNELDARSLQYKSQAAELALLTSQKLAATAIANHPISEIEAAVNECIEMLPQEPKLIVTVADKLLESIKPRLIEAAHSQGFEGKLVVNGQEEFMPTQCSIEWASGGLKRDMGDLQTTVEEIAQRRLQAESDVIDQPDLLQFKASDG